MSVCTTCGGYGFARGGSCWNCKGSGSEPEAHPQPETASPAGEVVALEAVAKPYWNGSGNKCWSIKDEDYQRLIAQPAGAFGDLPSEREIARIVLTAIQLSRKPRAVASHEAILDLFRRRG